MDTSNTSADHAQLAANRHTLHWGVALAMVLAPIAASFCAMFALTVCSPTAKAQCVYGAGPLARAFGGRVYQTKTIGDRQYVAMGSAGLVILDLSEPESIREIGSIRFLDIDYPLEVTLVQAREGMAFVLRGTTILAIDTTTPVRPQVVGSLDLDDEVVEIKLRGDVLYVATMLGGLHLINTADPAAMEISSTVPIASPADFGVSGDLCYLVTSAAGYVIDVSDPGNPMVVASGAPGGSRVTIGGQTAYVVRDTGSSYNSTDAIDLSNPSQPVVVSTFSTGGWLAGAGGILYTGDISFPDDDCIGEYWGWLRAIDVSEPADPSTLGTFNNVAWATMGEPLANGPLQGQIILAYSGGLGIYEGPNQGFEPVSHFKPALSSMSQSGANNDFLAGLTIGRASPENAYPPLRYDRVHIDASDPSHPTRKVTGSVIADIRWRMRSVIGTRAILTGEYQFDSCNDGDEYGYLGVMSLDPDMEPEIVTLDSDREGSFRFFTNTNETMYALKTRGITSTGKQLSIYDLSTSGTPVLQSRIDLPYSSDYRALAVQDEYLYASIYPSGVEVFDVSDPTAPSSIGVYTLSDTLSQSGSMHPLDDGRLIVLTMTGFVVLDSSDPTQLVQLAALPFAQHIIASPMGVFDIDKDHVLVWAEDELWVIDMTRRHSPRVRYTAGIKLYEYSPAGSVVGVVEDLVYTEAEGQLTIFDINATTELAEIGATPTADAPFHTAINGGLAFVSDYYGGLRIFDVSDARDSVEIGTYATTDRTYQSVVAESGGDMLAYVADGADGLTVLDVSEPTTPTVVGSLVTSDLALAVAVEGDFAFVATRFDGLQIIDISSPALPILVGSVDTPGSAQGVTLAGHLAYVADGSGGVQVIDAANRSSPTIIGSYNTPQSARQVLVRGLVAYVPDRSTGLLALDISDPTSPQLIGTIGGMTDARSVTAWGHLAFVADFDGRVHMVDIADPANMELLQSIATNGTARSITNDGRMLYLADGDAGLTILEAQPCWYRPCPADLNNDSLLDFFDVQAFLAAFAVSDGLADWNDDGAIDFFDVLDYLNQFTAGCP